MRLADRQVHPEDDGLVFDYGIRFVWYSRVAQVREVLEAGSEILFKCFCICQIAPIRRLRSSAEAGVVPQMWRARKRIRHREEFSHPDHSVKRRWAPAVLSASFSDREGM